MVYQLMFAVITPALISGAYAERIKFSAMTLFTTLWVFVVYFPMAHMVWGKGGLLNAYLGGSIPTFDFAGGTVVHITSGVSALVCALYLGKRTGYPSEADEAAQLGAERDRRLPAVGGLVRIQCGQRAGGFGAGHQRFRRDALRGGRGGFGLDGWRSGCTPGKPSMLGGISGAVAGLVAITPASGFVKPMPALLIGLLAGLFCFWMVTAVKRMFGYDDSLDAFGVHGAGGTLGALLTGVFATNAVNDAQINGKVFPLGLVDGNAGPDRESGHRRADCAGSWRLWAH